MRTLLVLLSLAAFTPAGASAGPTSPVRRFALLVGANRGAADRVPLRYAVADAERFADVLTRMGGVQGADHVVLRDPSRQELMDGLALTGGRAARDRSCGRRLRGCPGDVERGVPGYEVYYDYEQQKQLLSSSLNLAEGQRHELARAEMKEAERVPTRRRGTDGEGASGDLLDGRFRFEYGWLSRVSFVHWVKPELGLHLSHDPNSSHGGWSTLLGARYYPWLSGQFRPYTGLGLGTFNDVRFQPLPRLQLFERAQARRGLRAGRGLLHRAPLQRGSEEPGQLRLRPEPARHLGQHRLDLRRVTASVTLTSGAAPSASGSDLHRLRPREDHRRRARLRDPVPGARRRSSVDQHGSRSEHDRPAHVWHPARGEGTHDAVVDPSRRLALDEDVRRSGRHYGAAVSGAVTRPRRLCGERGHGGQHRGGSKECSTIRRRLHRYLAQLMLTVEPLIVSAPAARTSIEPPRTSVLFWLFRSVVTVLAFSFCPAK